MRWTRFEIKNCGRYSRSQPLVNGLAIAGLGKKHAREHREREMRKERERKKNDSEEEKYLYLTKHAKDGSGNRLIGGTDPPAVYTVVLRPQWTCGGR